MRLELTFENANDEVKSLAEQGIVRPLDKYLRKYIDKIPYVTKRAVMVITDPGRDIITGMVYLMYIPSDIDDEKRDVVNAAIQRIIQLFKNSGITVAWEGRDN